MYKGINIYLHYERGLPFDYGGFHHRFGYLWHARMDPLRLAALHTYSKQDLLDIAKAIIDAAERAELPT